MQFLKDLVEYHNEPRKLGEGFMGLALGYEQRRSHLTSEIIKQIEHIEADEHR